MNALPRVRSGLLRHPLDNQVLVYDSRDGLVHLLDPATACVMQLLEEGVTTADEIISQIAIRLDVPRNAEFLPLALDELRKAGLLDLSAVTTPAPLGEVNRRDMIRRLALSGAAAMLVPAVATLTATPGYAQTSGGSKGPCEACVPGDCISKNCVNGVCDGSGNASSVPNGGVCSGNGNCCSNNCFVTAGGSKGICVP
ncbi:MAG: HPr-rel-A system PqqD family peptide chaperone [Gemmatimonadaceae bacterium]